MQAFCEPPAISLLFYMRTLVDVGLYSFVLSYTNQVNCLTKEMADSKSETLFGPAVAAASHKREWSESRDSTQISKNRFDIYKKGRRVFAVRSDSESRGIQSTMSGNATTTTDVNQLEDGARSAGLLVMSLGLAIAASLTVWVLRHRTSPVVRAMQPLFLLVLLFGSVCTLVTVIPMGIDESNSNNPGSACLARIWLDVVGTTLVLSALFSKLWRVNQIFRASAAFQRKTVRARDVLWPFAILFTLNVVFLIVETVKDPPTWVREPVERSDGNSTVGLCQSQGIGYLMETLRNIVTVVAVVILCVQAYRARDISSEYSEARGVALALFSWLQASIIAEPMGYMLEETNTKAKYTLAVLYTVSVNISMLLFIFIPIVSHERKAERKARRNAGGSSRPTNVRVTGLATTTNTSGDSAALRAALGRISDLESQLRSADSRNQQLEDELQGKQRPKTVDSDEEYDDNDGDGDDDDNNQKRNDEEQPR